MSYRALISHLIGLSGYIWLNSCVPRPSEPEIPGTDISAASKTVEPERDEDVVPTIIEIVEPEISVEIVPVVNTSVDRSQITFVLPAELNTQHLRFIDKSLREISDKSVKHILADSVQDDSLSVLIAQTIFNDLLTNIPNYEFLSATASGDSLFINYRLNKTFIDHIIKPYLDTYAHPAQKPIAPLFTSHHNPPAIESVSELTLLLPCEDSSVPTQALLLPNAPRNYRNGTHRGIDFYVNWGTPVRAVSGGIVIRADHHFEEVQPDFREQLLAQAKQLGHTPADVFEHVLVGQSVYIDHGFDLVPGYRAVSIYAHLSHINGEIKPGVTVSTGQMIALSGNSGTKDSTLGTRKGAHLHWELILQDKGGEYYLGQGWAMNELSNLLLRIFSK